MDKHTLELLEFEKIADDLASYCFSEEAGEKIYYQPFLHDPKELSSFLDMIDDFEKLLVRSAKGFSSFCPSTTGITEKLRKEGTVLREEELCDLRQMLICGRLLRQFITTSHYEGERPVPVESRLWKYADSLPRLAALEKKINTVITQEGAVDEKIPSLLAIRKKITRLHNDISSIADSYLKKTEYQSYFQDQTAVQKDGRTVLPVKSQHKQRINGLVQDMSASGATLFIEPYELVEKNNEISIEKGKYRQEIHRILLELTDALREHVDEIEETGNIIPEIDLLYCRARYSMLHDCKRVEITEREIFLTEARHPLLGAEAVPIQFTAMPDTRVVVISGPTTGGKTVGLKTVGLLSVMHQYGMKLPVEENSKLPLFSNVYSDIGDEQSIDLSLSTFSGHMKRISSICSEADKDSLVLLDELGSGTDAMEGGALAMAVLDFLSNLGCTTVVTTHQSSLKNYAFGKSCAENACVEFDLERLRPTFRLLSGIPGESHALEIAEIMGMGRRIMKQAKEYQEKGLSDINTIMKEITAKQQEILLREEELEAREKEYENKKEKLLRKEDEVREEREKLQRKDIRELQQFTRETRRKLENVVRNLREGEITKKKTRELKQFTEELERKIEHEETVLEAEEKKRDEQLSTGQFEFRKGMDVRLADTGKRGTLLRSEKEGRWTVAVGTIKIETDAENILPLAKDSDRKVETGIDYSAEKSRIPLELDVRGMRYEEAQNELRKYLDSAVLQGMERIAIIHGKGEGVLQDAVRKVLEELPVVEGHSFAPAETGGYGKTLVTLRKGN